MRDTAYATEIATASDGFGQTIERIFVKGEYQREEIRFSWWSNGNLVIRPLDLPEDELLPLVCEAIRKGVFSTQFLKGLHEALYDIRQGQRDAEGT
jgi:hypothetical protein